MKIFYFNYRVDSFQYLGLYWRFTALTDAIAFEKVLENTSQKMESKGETSVMLHTNIETLGQF